MAYIGVADIRLECRGAHITVAKEARGGRPVNYRHYLGELATKPQAVRQVAPELLNELGDPYVKLWALLSGRYGDLDAARVVAKLAGAIVEHGERLVTDTLQEILAGGPATPAPQSVNPAAVMVPSTLQAYTIEATPAAHYDTLLEAQR
jgi:hypothetical protein